jgi:serine protease AprX
LYGPFDTLDVTSPLAHRDFTPDGRVSNPPDSGDPGQPLATHATARMDRFGHGSHVAGIIAGFWQSPKPDGEPVVGSELRDETTDQPIPQRESLRTISGVAPRAKLVSLKVIADVTRSDQAKQTAGQGKVSWILIAIDQIQQWNQNGKRQLIHGVNMSLGYDFDPRWFACGQSPLCVEVNRLVRSGVCVVVSAGNGGYTAYVSPAGQVLSQYTSLSITDPGNADLAITVGSTHREMPHTYGVSYFSSRGPTGDGRLKPDLLAPGERIISCAAGREIPKYPVKDEQGADLGEVLYCEQTGTSMAAPHVSGAVAAFLSVRSEFKGDPEKVKEIFLANAIDLHRESCFQGAGLLDLMKVLQAV